MEVEALPLQVALLTMELASVRQQLTTLGNLLIAAGLAIGGDA
jgi:hypothetical protein